MFFQHRSIRHKLSLVVIASSMVVLLLLGGLIGVTEYISIRQNLAQEQQTLAQILGHQLAKPVMKKDRAAAKAILAALAGDGGIKAAYLFDAEGAPLAQFLDVRARSFVEKVLKADFPDRLPPEWQNQSTPISRYGVNRLALFAPLYYQDIQIGSLYLLSDLQELNQKLLELLILVLLIGGSGVGMAWGLAGRLSRPISQPLFELTRTMEQISVQGNYQLRAERMSGDEIGQLVDGFNEMLGQIELRDQKLEDYQHSLEGTVQARTAQLRETVERLVEAKQQSDAANQAKSAFLANMTHELRTPLVGVLGMNELLMESRLDSLQQGLASTVQKSGQSLLGLIDEILDFSRLERGSLDLQLENCHISQLVEEVLSAQEDRASEKGLELICRMEPEAASLVEVDPRRLKQILLHLVDNAIKFTRQGHVRLSLSLEESGKTLFEVADTGIGIDDQSQKEIFQAFSQVDSSSAKHFGGTGLGLSIVRELTTLMGGRVDLESRPGVGTRFTVTLPLRRITPTQKNARGRTPGIAEHSCAAAHLLLVDDNLSTRELIAFSLEQSRWTMVQATSAEEALDILENREFRLILMDVNLPSMNGLEAVRCLRKRGDTTPVFALTGHGGEKLFAECRAAGMQGVLRKPFRQQELFDLLDPFCSAQDQGTDCLAGEG